MRLNHVVTPSKYLISLPSDLSHSLVILMPFSLAMQIIIYIYDKMRSTPVLAENSPVLPQNSCGVIPRAGIKL